MPDMENPDSDRPLEDIEATEATPLLGDRSSRGFQSLFTHHIPVASLFLYVCLFLAMELGNSLPANSLVQVVEEALCRGAADCAANDDVQSSLAILMGWYHAAMILPGLLIIGPLPQFYVLRLCLNHHRVDHHRRTAHCAAIWNACRPLRAETVSRAEYFRHSPDWSVCESHL